jgi:hypothetical protein
MRLREKEHAVANASVSLRRTFLQHVILPTWLNPVVANTNTSTLEETREVHSRYTDVTYRSGLPVDPEPRISEHLGNPNEPIGEALDMGTAAGRCIKRQQPHCIVPRFVAMQSRTILAKLGHNPRRQRDSARL